MPQKTFRQNMETLKCFNDMMYTKYLRCQTCPNGYIFIIIKLMHSKISSNGPLRVHLPTTVEITKEFVHGKFLNSGLTQKFLNYFSLERTQGDTQFFFPNSPYILLRFSWLFSHYLPEMDNKEEIMAKMVKSLSLSFNSAPTHN